MPFGNAVPDNTVPLDNAGLGVTAPEAEGDVVATVGQIGSIWPASRLITLRASSSVPA